MQTEEKAEEIMKMLENSPLDMFLRSSYIKQYMIYTWMWKALTKFSGLPFSRAIIPEMTEAVKSVMEKVEEFNKAMDEKEENKEKKPWQLPWMVNIIDYKSLYPNIVISSEDHNEEEWTDDKIVAEISLEDLEKELEDAIEEDNNSLAEVDGVERELEIMFKDIMFGEGDTDSWFASEMEQNPAPLEEAGDGPEEVGRQMHEAMARTHGLRRRIGECDEAYRRRVLDSVIPPGRVRLPDYENQDGSIIRGGPNRMCSRGRGGGGVFLAHQRGNDLNYCQRCERVGCTGERMEKAIKNEFCAGFVDKIKVYKDCIICNNRMDTPEQFPIGFPDKWKACCYCVEVWSIMSGLPNNLVGLSKGEVEEKWKLYGKKMEAIFTL